MLILQDSCRKIKDNMSEILKKIQNEEYEALVLLDELCKSNDIKYYMRGGSALGVVKYGGFVPWDDDIDIALPRKDYNKLINIAPQLMDNNILFVSYQKIENAHCYFPRVILKKDYCKANNYPINNERGLVLIDILPIDGMPNSIIKMKIHIAKAYFYRILASLWTLEVSETVSMHGGKKDAILRILHALKIHKLYKQDDIYNKLDAMYSKYGFLECRNSGMLASSKLKKEIVPSEWWGEGRIGKFNEIDVMLPSKADLYLKKLFGDNYKEYEPNESERKKSHLTGTGE